MADYADLYDARAFEIHARQHALDLRTGALRWELDPEAGRIRFSDGTEAAVQTIGTHSFVSDTWRWADTNPQSNLRRERTELVRRVRGQLTTCRWFTEDEFGFPDEVGAPSADGLAGITALDGGADAYFAGEHADGALFVAVEGLGPTPDYSLEWFKAAYADIMWVPGDLVRRVRAFAEAQEGLLLEDTEGRLRLGFGQEGWAEIRYRRTASGGTTMKFRTSE